MQHIKFGRTGLRVSRLCLGTMTFGLQCNEHEGHAIMDAAGEGGIDFLDTADVYPLGGDRTTVGRTEEIVGDLAEGQAARLCAGHQVRRRRPAASPGTRGCAASISWRPSTPP